MTQKAPLVSDSIPEHSPSDLRYEEALLRSVFRCDMNSTEEPGDGVVARQARALLQSEVPAGKPGRTVLYAEDNPGYVPWPESIFGRFPDLRLVTAEDIAHGVEVARVLQPEVIVMGLILPRARRIKAVKILRGDPVTEFIPVIALGASVRSRHKAQGLEAGFFRRVPKPIRNDDLAEALSEAFEFSAMKRRALIGDKDPLV